MGTAGGWMVVDGGSGRPVGLARAPTPAGALATLAEAAWPLAFRNGAERAELASAFGERGPAVAGLLAGMAEAAWFSRAGAGPDAGERGALDLLASSLGGGRPGWLPSWAEAGRVLGRLAPAAVEAADGLRRSARRAALQAGMDEELEGALRVCALVVTARTTPHREADEAVRLAASGAAVFWLSGLVAATVAGVPGGPLEAAGHLLLAGRWPIGADGTTWWAL